MRWVSNLSGHCWISRRNLSCAVGSRITGAPWTGSGGTIVPGPPSVRCWLYCSGGAAGLTGHCAVPLAGHDPGWPPGHWPEGPLGLCVGGLTGLCIGGPLDTCEGGFVGGPSRCLVMYLAVWNCSSGEFTAYDLKQCNIKTSIISEISSNRSPYTDPRRNNYHDR